MKFENLPITIDGVTVDEEEWDLSKRFHKAEAVIVLFTDVDPDNDTFRIGAKMYHIHDTISGDHWAAVPIAASYDDVTEKWYPYDGLGISITDAIDSHTAWGNDNMDVLDWMIFTSLK